MSMRNIQLGGLRNKLADGATPKAYSARNHLRGSIPWAFDYDEGEAESEDEGGVGDCFI